MGERHGRGPGQGNGAPQRAPRGGGLLRRTRRREALAPPLQKGEVVVAS